MKHIQFLIYTVQYWQNELNDSFFYRIFTFPVILIYIEKVEV